MTALHDENLDHFSRPQKRELYESGNKVNASIESERTVDDCSDNELRTARKILYKHINNTPNGYEFFSHKGASHKRALVHIMRKIDNQEIATSAQLLEVVKQIVHQHQSKQLSDMWHEITSAIQPNNGSDELASPGCGVS